MAARASSGGGNWIAPVLLIGGVGYFAYKKLAPAVAEKKKLQQYRTTIRVTMPAMRFKGDNVEFDVYVQNPNPKPLTVNAIVGDVFIQSQAKTYKLGNVFRYGNTVIQPTAETKFTFQVRARFLGFLAYFTDMRDGKISHQTGKFIGSITIDGHLIRITESIRIS